MQLIIFLQISDYNVQINEFVKNKTKISLQAQDSIYFPVIDAEVLYIPVSIRLHICNDIYKCY